MYDVTISATVSPIAGDVDRGTAAVGTSAASGMARILSAMSCFCTLPVGVRGSCVEEMHAVRDLETREQLATTLLHLGRRRLRTGTDDGNLDDLAEHVVGHGKGGALVDAFHGVDDLLDLPGKNIFPADIDHVLAPADDVDVARPRRGSPDPHSGNSRRG